MSVKEQRAHKDRLERRICTGSRAVEWVLCAASLWAALVMAWTPTVLRHEPPPFYRVINDHFDAWVIGLIIGLVPLIHIVGLLLSTCPPRGDEECDDQPCEDPPRLQRWGAKLRREGAMGQVGVWAFLSIIYVLLYTQHREVTMGSGICVIFAVCASITSYCISQEHSRHKVRRELKQLISQNDGRSPREVLEGLAR